MKREFTRQAFWTVLAFAVTAGGLSHAAENLIANGDFSKGALAPWKLIIMKGAPAADAAVQDGVLRISANAAADEIYHRQLIQWLALQPGNRYRLTFDAKIGAENDAEIAVVVLPKSQEKGQYSLFKRFKFSPDWESYQAYFSAKESAADEPLAIKFSLGALDTNFSLRNVVVKQITPKSNE